VATFTHASLVVGTYTDTASYGGTADFAPCTTGTIVTAAGNGNGAGSGLGGYRGDNGPATNAELSVPVGVAVDAAGDLFIADSYNNVVRQATPAVAVTISAPTATFLEQDTRTEGNWINTYGTQGSEVIGNATSLPSCATVTPSGQASHIWTTSTTNPRALQQAGTGRIAATWYSATSFTVDVNLSDGKAHDLELYFLDWESTVRSEQVQISNAATGAVLDTETVSSFHSGVYENWLVSGNIVITITRLTGANAVLSGLFIGAAINDNPGFAIGAAVPGDLTNPSVPSYGTSDSSTPNPAAKRDNFAAIVPRIVSPIAGGSSHGSAISPGTTDIDLALEALTADTSTHDLALEQVMNDAWGRRMSRRWETGVKSLHSGR
jgi:hypothetical protein